jgi:predicted lipid-binding transport protein (Tim44 family)
VFNLTPDETAMKTFLRTAVCVLALSTALAPTLAEAKRLGGGGSSGMQRSAPAPKPAQQPGTPAQTPNQAPVQQAVPGAATAATGAAAAAGKRSWMGPLAGLAAGIGLAALLSHFGLGEAFADMMMIALLALVAVFAIRWLMNRNRKTAPTLAPAGAGAGFGGQPMQRGSHEASWPSAAPQSGSSPSVSMPGSAAASFGAAPAAAAFAPSLPADFDRAGFERAARMIFIRMQSANDRADLEDLRRFTTPEMFAAIRVDLQDRQGAAQQTDVVEVRAEAIDFARESDRDIVSVRYSGLIREEAGRDAQAFDEIWHLVREHARSDGSWLIAGIQQSH